MYHNCEKYISKKTTFLFLIMSMILYYSCTKTNKEKEISSATIKKVVERLLEIRKDGNKFLIEKGVTQVAKFWDQSEGDFEEFCINNYAKSEEDRFKLFQRLSRNFEILLGNFNKITVELLKPVHLSTEELLPVDELFSEYSVSSHFIDDMFKSKIAFITMLNFPFFTLEEKEKLGKNWSRLEWAYARLGDVFVTYVPADVQKKITEEIAKADNYITNYNIYMHNVITKDKQKLFPKGMKLISHWNLRDEIKANYVDTINGLLKQRIIYQIMKNIIYQTIPKEVVNNDKFEWDPFNNVLYENGTQVNFTPEKDIRYKHVLNIFQVIRNADKYYPEALNTYIKRKSNLDYEMSLDEIESLFIDYVSSPVFKEIGKLITKRLKRDLEPFDIWYDGFKVRSSLPQEQLNQITKEKFPNAQKFSEFIPTILIKLGFNKKEAEEISSKIKVEPARGAGHAWGAEMRGDYSYLRTRINPEGMDYKGFNIAMHELGHNVEQTISLYNIDYYMLRGIPNTAFTEALAFIFQKRDLKILDFDVKDTLLKYYEILDLAWSLYEIMGVALVDINMWKFLYSNKKNINPEVLKNKVIEIAKEIWNKYYYPVFNIKDEPILAIYSHMIDAPLYLPAYPLGHIIEYQLETYLKDKNFAEEIIRIYSIGRLTPNMWMNKAIGSNVSVQPLINDVEVALKKISSLN